MMQPRKQNYQVLDIENWHCDVWIENEVDWVRTLILSTLHSARQKMEMDSANYFLFVLWKNTLPKEYFNMLLCLTVKFKFMMKVGWCNHEAKNLHGKPIIFSPNFTEVLLFIQHSHTLFFYSFPLSLLKAHQKQWKERNFLLAFRKWLLFLYFMMVDERRGLGIMRTRVWFAWQFDRHGSRKIASKTHIEMLAANNIHNKQPQFF